MSLYLDTSVVVPLFVDEALSETLASWIVAEGSVPFVSDLTKTEFQAVISRLIRSNRIDADRATAIRDLFAIWTGDSTESLENLPADIRSAALLVQVPLPKLLAADATHLATCRRLGLTLATADRDLQSIADREGVRWDCPR